MTDENTQKIVEALAYIAHNLQSIQQELQQINSTLASRR